MVSFYLKPKALPRLSLLGYRVLSSFNKQMDHIYQAEKRLERLKEALKEKKNGDIALEFLEHLRAKGLSTIRLVKYAPTLRALACTPSCLA
jgi:nicotinic acid mononucleotide adenylyltransferase